MRVTTYNPLLHIERFQPFFMHVRYSKDGQREEKISRKEFIRGYKNVRML